MAERIVHLVDDEESIRKSVGFMLRTAGYSVHPWPDGIQFLRNVTPPGEGCVLLDIRMPGMDGLEIQAEMTRRGLRMPVIILTGHGDVNIAVRAMKAGALDFLEKPFDRNALLPIIETAFEQIADESKRLSEASEAMLRIAALTPREREVIAGLAHGYPNKTIAYDLGISPRTVEVHRANVMSKLGVASFPEALRIAFAAGLGTD